MYDIDHEKPQGPESLPAEGTPGGIETLQQRIARYSAGHVETLAMANYARSLLGVSPAATPALVARLAKCASWLHFRHYLESDELRLHAAPFCAKHLICPFCAMRRSARSLKAYLDRWEAIQQQHQDLSLYFVTLTVKNAPDLDERFRHLSGSYRGMQQARRHAANGYRAPIEFSKALGGFHAIEVTNRGNGWHPHLHSVWACREQPLNGPLSHEWHQFTGDSYITDVRPITDPVEGFLEVLKYSLKFSDLDLSQRWHAFEVMGGRRLLDCFGLFRGVDISDLSDGQGDGPYLDLFYRWQQGRGYSLEGHKVAA